ncbi:hypothetical protein Q5H92_07885 [Hymenobacter sp. M29]|uniref:Uncharacterized protein n=2 Tax=Hymenobacter mellowenesis TaxID=3063995 RepID=A0ABT9A8V5_9BACT|nr:hypothetical protein [Hymenobacter sp. M29]
MASLIPLHTPSLAAIQQGAWEMATLLVEGADFDTSKAVVVQLTNIDFLNEGYGYDLLSRISAGLAGFKICTKGSKKGEKYATLFFSRVEYIRAIQGLEAEFNPLSFKDLTLLRRVIIDLRHQGKLTPIELTTRAKQMAPFTEFDMTLKKRK